MPRQELLVPVAGGHLDDRGQQAVADVRVEVPGSRRPPQVGSHRLADQVRSRRALVVIAHRLDQAGRVREQLVDRDRSLVRRDAVQEPADPVGHSQSSHHLQFQDRCCRELLGHRHEVVDGVAAGLGSRFLVRKTPSLADEHLAVDRGDERSARALRQIGWVEDVCPVQLRLRASRGVDDGAPSQEVVSMTIAAAAAMACLSPGCIATWRRPLGGARRRSSRRAVRWATSRSIRAQSPAHSNRSSSTLPGWAAAAADQVSTATTAAVVTVATVVPRRGLRRRTRSDQPPRTSPTASRTIPCSAARSSARSHNSAPSRSRRSRGYAHKHVRRMRRLTPGPPGPARRARSRWRAADRPRPRERSDPAR